MLEVELHLVAGSERGSQLGAQLETGVRLSVHGFDEGGHAVLAVPLCGVHRHVRIAEQLRGGRRGRRGRADAGVHGQRAIPYGDRHGKRLEDPSGQALRLGGSGRGVEEDGELVPSEAGDRIARAGHGGEPLADLAQQLVARGVTKAVVDGLEVVEVMTSSATSSADSVDARSRARWTRSRSTARLASPVRVSRDAWRRSSSCSSLWAVTSRPLRTIPPT